jgi:thiol-disulfide isomerase/thioredoxin
MKAIVQNRWGWLAARLMLGTVFIFASVLKIFDTGGFVTTVAGYGMLPDALAHLYGWVIPWVELAIGCALILGVFVRFAALISAPVTLSFGIASIYALIKAPGGTCGCFGNFINLNHQTSLTIDILMLALAAVLFIHKENDFFTLGHGFSKISPVRMNNRTFFSISQVMGLILLIAIVGGTVYGVRITTTPNVMTPIADYALPAPFNEQVGNYIDEGKPVLFIVYAEGCLPCEEAKPTIDAFESEFGDRVAFLRVDYWQYESQMKQMDIINTPTLLLFTVRNSDGTFAASMRQQTGIREDILRGALQSAANK